MNAEERRVDQELDHLSLDLSALSNETRLRLLHLLTRPRYKEEVGEALGMSRQSASKHIDKLAERGFVRELQGWRETGPVMEFQVVPQRLFALGMRIADMGKLEPEGGPARRVPDRTVHLEGPPDGGQQEPEPASAHLLVINGPAAGTRFPLAGDQPRWTLGRDDDRDLCLKHDPFASGRHAEVQLDPMGHAIVDVYSANGTQLNFAKLPHGGRAPLEPGDVLGIGRTYLVYQRRR